MRNEKAHKIVILSGMSHLPVSINPFNESWRQMTNEVKGSLLL
jgi:aspartate/tyrosine/aromatic aminotransferase